MIKIILLMQNMSSSLTIFYKMYTKFVVFVLLAIYSEFADSCKKGWVRRKNNCYYVTTIKESWNDAFDHCKKLGGDMAKVTSKEDNDFMKDMAKKTGASVWIGGMNVGNAKNAWRWSSTMEKISFTNWHPGQPGGTESCLCLHQSTSYTWHDCQCIPNKFFAICEAQNKFEQGCCCTANHLLQELMKCKKAD